MYIGGVRIISRKKLREYWQREGRAEQPLKAWFQEAKRARWASPNEIKVNYAGASILKNNRVVFNIGGNKYRLVVRINYKYARVLIRFVGTHKEYDKIDAETI